MIAGSANGSKFHHLYLPPLTAVLSRAWTAPNRVQVSPAQELEQLIYKLYFQYIIQPLMLGEVQQTFFTVKDLSAQQFITAFSQYLKKNNLIERPAWVDLVKTATRNQLAPLDDDWIYIRVASLARKIYLRPHTGVRLLSHIYGGLKRGGCRPEGHDHASTKIIRWGLQQLQKQKLIKKDKKGNGLKINSRIISDQGRRTLNRITTEYIKNRK